jgi:uncharacterized protein YqiB (DUF1249 family)
MFMSAWLPLERLFRSRRFANLLELYEHNFRRLHRLVPDLDRLHTDLCSRVGGAEDLHLHVLERHRFTVDLAISHYFDAGGESFPSPDLTIRVYLDSAQAELLRLPDALTVMIEEERGAKSSLEKRWIANLFLQRWLDYCLHQGHRFTQDVRDRHDADTHSLVEV